MSLYLLDTEIVSLFQRGHPAICARVQNHPASDVAITVLTVEEQLSGWYKELRRAKKSATLAGVHQRMADTVGFYSLLVIYSLTESAIRRYDALRLLKLKVRKMDLRIAAIVFEHQATLVTRNLRDFKRVPGLPIEDWTN